MKLFSVKTGLLRVNTYFLVDEATKNAVIIDSGENYKTIISTIEQLKVNIKAVLLTHAHFDHAGNVKALQDDGIKIYISIIDAPKLSNEQNLAKDFGRKILPCTPDYTFSDGDVLEFDGIKIEVIETPGHTDGSVTFKVQNKLFTGDTLFYDTIGRTDFATGNIYDMIKSVNKLFNLSGDYEVYPGHDEFTTLNRERKYNMIKEYDRQ
jgi:glyoxylase-like metal-dependent hydrolase (beta-lactamase superfamily II)